MTTTPADAMAEALREDDHERHFSPNTYTPAFAVRAVRILAALERAGFVVVPVVATEAMIEGAKYPVVYNNRGEGIDPSPRLAWDRMLAARPK